MPEIIKKPLIWALLLPEAGFRSQVLGLAEALSGQVVEKNVDLLKPWSLLPGHLCPRPFSGLDPMLDRLEPPWPDIVVACGGRTIALALAIKRAAGDKTLAIYIQNPKGAAKFFDLVVSMRHDGLNGPNVLTIDTAIHRVTEAKLESARSEWQERFSPLHGPLVGVILGGRSHSLRFTPAVADKMLADLATLAKTSNASYFITPSRRTEPEIAARFKAFAESQPSARFWDGIGKNPYFAMLALSDALIVTEDSVSMVSEALASGKPVATVPLEGKARRHEAFIRHLLKTNAIIRFDGQLPMAAATKRPDDIERATEAVLNLLAVKA